MIFNVGTWYKIPKFNGYEIMFDGMYYHVRSFKHFNKYKNGYELPYDHYRKGGIYIGSYYEMTAYDNTRRRYTIDKLLKLMDDESYYVTESTGRNISSRNLTLPHQRKDRPEKKKGHQAEYFTAGDLFIRNKKPEYAAKKTNYTFGETHH